jgi:hypothetical protein
MRPKTSVHQPIIAGARRQHLSNMLRKWRRQPRKRSLLLFWALLSLALMSDAILLVLGVRLVGGSESVSPPADRNIHVPYAADAALWEPLRQWVIRVDGRRQLFESFSRKVVREITGDEWFEDRNPLAVVVSWMLNKDAKLNWDDYPCLRCEDAALRTVLYREGRNSSQMSREEQLHGRYVEPSVASSSQGLRKILRGVSAKGGASGDIPLSSLERHAVELDQRLTRFDQIRNVGREQWNSAEMQTPSAALVQTYCTGVKDCFAAALNDFLDASQQAMRAEGNPDDGRRLAREAWLNDYRPSRKAMYLSFLGMGLFTAAAMARIRWPRWRRVLLLSGLLACLGCLGWASAAIVYRAIREGTAAVSDGRQGMLWASSLVMGLSVCLTLLRRDVFLGWTGALVSGGGFFLANHWPPAFTEYWPPLPEAIAGDRWLAVQVLLLLSASASLALAWAVAAFTLGRILLASPTGERVRRLATLCVGPTRVGVVLLTASGLLDACRALALGSSWRGWNAQALGTLCVLPICAALLHAGRRGWMKPFAFLAGIVFAFTLVAMMGQTAICREIDKQTLGSALAGEGWFYAAGLVNLSLAAHAALRFYFGRQPILET